MENKNTIKGYKGFNPDLTCIGVLSNDTDLTLSVSL